MCVILAIDDENVIVELIRQALSHSGWSVEVADSGEEGIRKYDSGSYSLVITDIRMPGTDGLQVLEHIRKSHPKHIPVIGISGTPWLLEEKGFDAVLAKPFSLRSLCETVDGLVGGCTRLAASA